MVFKWFTSCFGGSSDKTKEVAQKEEVKAVIPSESVVDNRVSVKVSEQKQEKLPLGAVRSSSPAPLAQMAQGPQESAKQSYSISEEDVERKENPVIVVESISPAVEENPKPIVVETIVNQNSPIIAEDDQNAKEQIVVKSFAAEEVVQNNNSAQSPVEEDKEKNSGNEKKRSKNKKKNKNKNKNKKSGNTEWQKKESKTTV